MPPGPFVPQSFASFGELLKYLRRRERLTQLELSIAVGYSEAQISRLEKNQRLPDLTVLKALFIPALHLEEEPQIAERLLELAQSARQEDAPAPGIPPYKGLLFFDESDADLFFGREALTAHLVERVADLSMDAFMRFLAVVGASGSGKSSLVRAGLAVALKRAGWDVRVFTPTAQPLKMLVANLDALHAKHSEQALLIVDQFEEVFTLCRDEIERVAFVERLLALAAAPDTSHQPGEGNTTTVIALRADFYSHLAQYPLLRQTVAAEQEYIGQMTADELRRAIEEPAKRGGWEFETGLVDVLLQDIGAAGSQGPEPGALPLLSHALLATWEHRRGRVFTLDGYHASGGVRGAIAETAESLFTDQLNQKQQGLAHDVFLRLTELGEGTEDTRRRAALNELVRQGEEATQLRAVLNTLAEARLITLNEDSAEVAHEALIREWQRLHEWLTQDREGLKLHRHLTDSSREWEALERDAGALYRGARLAQAREWAVANKDRMNESELAFLKASLEQEQHDIVEREAQRQRELEAAQKLAENEKIRVQEQARSIKQLRQRAVYLFVVLTLAVIAAIVAGVFASQNGILASTNASIAATVQAESEARATQQTIAEENFTRAEAQRLAAEANILLKSNADPELIALLSIHSMNLQYSPQADTALSNAAGLDYPLHVFINREDYVSALGASPDGRYVAFAHLHDPENIVHLWDTESGKEIQQLVHDPSGQGCCGIYQLTFSPDSRYVFTHLGVRGDSFRGAMWDIRSGQQVFQFTQPALCNRSMYSPDGKYLTVGCENNTVQIWDWQTSRLVRKFILPSEQDLVVLYISSDTQYVVSCLWLKWGHTMQVWKLGDTITKVSEFPYSSNVTNYSYNPIMVSSDGRYVLVGDMDGTTHLMDTITGEEIRAFEAKNTVMSVAFSPDGNTILISSQDQFVRLYNRQTGEELRSIPLTDWAWVATFTPDGKYVLAGSDTGFVRMWKVQPRPHLPVFTGHTDVVFSSSFSPDGQLLATGGLDGLRLWQSSTGQLLRDLPEAGSLAGGTEFSADGRHLLSGNITGVATLWDVLTGQAERQFIHPSNFQIYDVAFSPDGRSILTAGVGEGAGGETSETVWLWDAEVTAEPKLKINTDGHPVFQAVFSPDGKYILEGSDEPVARLWDAKTGALVREFTGHTDWVTGVTFSMDGKTIATASRDNTARVWNAQTGQEIRQFLGHIEAVSSVAFSPDGLILATASADGTIRLWNVETGKELRRMAGHTAGVENAIFSPDGKLIASAGDDGIARLWDADYHDTMRYLCSRLLRDFTDDERTQYGLKDSIPTCPAK
jgi:WD40 repeat protein/transcriptional regulator with XRE-family HTH domain